MKGHRSIIFPTRTGWHRGKVPKRTKRRGQEREDGNEGGLGGGEGGTSQSRGTVDDRKGGDNANRPRPRSPHTASASHGGPCSASTSVSITESLTRRGPRDSSFRE